jgi:hypothetical protein
MIPPISASAQIRILAAEERLVMLQHHETAGGSTRVVGELEHLVGRQQDPRGEDAVPIFNIFPFDRRRIASADGADGLACVSGVLGRQLGVGRHGGQPSDQRLVLETALAQASQRQRGDVMGTEQPADDVQDGALTGPFQPNEQEGLFAANCPAVGDTP